MKRKGRQGQSRYPSRLGRTVLNGQPLQDLKQVVGSLACLLRMHSVVREARFCKTPEWRQRVNSFRRARRENAFGNSPRIGKKDFDLKTDPRSLQRQLQWHIVGKRDWGYEPLNMATMNNRHRPQVFPRTATEQKLAEIWCSIFDVDEVSIYDNFLDLGGDSILAMRCLNRVRDVFQTNLPIIALFSATASLGELAITIDNLHREEWGRE